jgi:crossover junction endodeoxyribonuclease RuvC
MMITVDRVILGIDPGTLIMGYGLVHQQGSRISMLSMGVLHLNKYTNQALKLRKIFERCLQLIDEYHPDVVSLEAPFFGKNVQSMLKLGRAQGVAMAAALYRDIEIVEYSPRRIKQSITGSGNASKEQVAEMLKRLLLFDEIPGHLDATDGLAAAVCHFMQNEAIPKPDLPRKAAKNKGGWEGFLRENPDRKF